MNDLVLRSLAPRPADGACGQAACSPMTGCKTCRLQGTACRRAGTRRGPRVASTQQSCRGPGSLRRFRMRGNTACRRMTGDSVACSPSSRAGAQAAAANSIVAQKYALCVPSVLWGCEQLRRGNAHGQRSTHLHGTSSITRRIEI